MSSSPAQPLPAAPAYGRNSVTEVLTSAAAAMGISGFTNQLSYRPADRICVVLVDGLGSALLKAAGGHAPFLRRAADSAPTLSSAFPSTTATSLASLGTGQVPGAHGMVGYDVLDPEQDKVVNMLGGWDRRVDPLTWQPHRTVFEQVESEVPVATVSLPKFAESAMTRAALRGGTFLPARSTHAKTAVAAEAMASNRRMLMYLYFNELDRAGHRYGCGSPEWEYELEELDGAMRRLSSQLPAGTRLLLTADHGMVDVPESNRYDYSTQGSLIQGVRHTGGEPRMVHLYLEPDATERTRAALIEAWSAAHGHQAWIMTRDEAVSAGYFGDTVSRTVLPRIGDVLVAAREPVAFYDTRRVRSAAMEVVGQHGSLTRAERHVPMLDIEVAGTAARRAGAGKAVRG
ncbi:alkaline phosphatase family protein [Arthrobacter castelli]|uniref:alkaline phosphatase family protein n=1 Tax=Arthrobacter castelli TaxID=271431 RepID=UPI000406FB81|nr:nucleotide pyrophosphatase/phosphodiesterase family protein [Arthrobacter castelli]